MLSPEEFAQNEHDEREYYGEDYRKDIVEQYKAIAERKERERQAKPTPFERNFVSRLRNKHFDKHF